MFDSYEVLNGYSKCDYVLKDPSNLASILNEHLKYKTKS
jgi:hypothetical protein